MKGKFAKIKKTKRKNGTYRVQIDCSEEMLTDQSDKNSADINNIVANYHKTGLLPEVRNKVARYVDNTNVMDLMEAHQFISEAKQMFMELPAHIRKLMDNDPRNLEQFISNPENKEVLVKYGVLEENKKVIDDTVKPKQDVETSPPKPKTEVKTEEK